MSGTRWNAADDARLKTLYAAGVQVDDIAAQMGRSHESVKHRTANLGMRRREQSPIDSALVMELAKNGLRASGIPNVTASQAGNKLSRMTAAGKLYRAVISHKNVVFFTTIEAARAYENAHRKPAPSLVIKNKAPWPADAPMVITSATKFTYAPKPPERVYRTATFNQYA